MSFIFRYPGTYIKAAGELKGNHPAQCQGLHIGIQPDIIVCAPTTIVRQCPVKIALFYYTESAPPFKTPTACLWPSTARHGCRGWTILWWSGCSQ